MPGLRRITFVRVSVEDGVPVAAEAVGLAHRLPCTVPISVSRAHELAAAGVPIVTRKLALAR